MGGLVSTEPVVGTVVKDSPAEKAGLLPEDRIIKINDKNIRIFNDIPRIMITNLGTEINLTIQRQDKEIELKITPRIETTKDDLGNEIKIPRIGIGSKKITVEKVGIPQAIWEATKRTYMFCETTLIALGQIISGERSFKESIQGPIGMAKLSGQAVQHSLPMVFIIMANISASLALINLFPIPMLDGGHLLYYAIEAVRGKPLAKHFQEWGLRIGMSLIAMLMMYTIINDVTKLLK
jgi:regulator of sigma E protease